MSDNFNAAVKVRLAKKNSDELEIRGIDPNFNDFECGC
jgi:hypothetical protein